MTISTDLKRVQYNGNGVTTAFTFASRVLDASHVKCIVTNSLGVDTTLILNTDYTVAGVGGTSATINTTVAVASGSVLTISRNVPFTQTADYIPNSQFPAETHENALDKLTMIDQQQQDAVDRSLKFPETDPTSLVATLPSAANRANKVLAFDSSGNLSTTTTDAANVVAAQAAADAAAASAALAQATAAGFKQKNSCRAASTANVNIASAPASIDTITLAVNDRVLLKNQTTTSQNGIYQFNGTGAALTRTTDANTWAQLISASVAVDQGATNADSLWFCPVDTGGTLGVTAVTFVPNPITIPDASIAEAKYQTGSVSARAINDGQISWSKLASSIIASVSDMLNGVGSLILSAANFKTYMDTYIFTPIAVGYVTVSGTTPTLVNQKGALSISVSRTALGAYRLTFGNALADTNYYVICTVAQGEAPGGTRHISMGINPTGTKSTTICDLLVQLTTAGPTSAGGDPANFTFAIYKY